MENAIKVILADDKARYRQTVREILELFRIDVIGEASNGRDLMLLLKEKKPDIILLDLEMPVMDGREAFDLIRKEYPLIKIIILSFYFENLLIENYIERGASGYIPKDAMMPDIVKSALKEVMKGSIFIFEKPADEYKFTPRQKEMLPLIFEGLTNDEIAAEIFISKRAVEKQRHNIYEKSGALKAIDFYKYAFTKGLHFLGGYRRKKKSS